MKKWYAPCLVLLVTALTTQLTGCAGTSRTIARWTGRDVPSEKLAEIDGATKTSDGVKKPGKAPSTTSDLAAASKSKRSATESQVADRGSGSSSSERKPTSRTTSTDVEGSLFASRNSSRNSKSADPFEDPPLTRSEAVAKTDAPAVPPIGTAKLSPGVLKPPSAAGQVAQGTQKLTPSVPKVSAPPKAEVAQASAADGLPEWALEEPTSTPPSVPPISQTAATRFQPGQPAPEMPQAEAPRPQVPLVKPAPSTSLASLCPEAKGEVRELVKALDSTDVETVKRTIHRLGRMQTHSAAAAPALRKLLHNEDGFVRVHAALALVRMQLPSTEVTDTLILGLRSADPGIRSFSAAVLAEMGPHSADALPALSAALNDSDGYVRLHVAEVLIRQDEWSHAALQALNDSLKHSDENVRWLATYSLAELAPQSDDAVASLTNALKDPVAKVQIGAAYALGEIGPMAAPALGELERCQLSPNSELKSAADYAISQIRP